MGLSLTFIRNIVTLDSAIYTGVLIASWGFLVVAIIITLISFHLSQWGLSIQLERAEKYYMQNDVKCVKESNVPAILTDYAAYASSSMFVVGIILLMIFVTTNIETERKQMSDQQSQNPTSNEGTSQQKANAGANVPKIQAPSSNKPIENIGKEGANVPKIQPVSPVNEKINNGANVPKIQQISPTKPVTPPSQSGSDSSSS